MTKSNATKKSKTVMTRSKHQSNVAKELRQAVLLDLCNRIEGAKSASGDSDRIPYGMVQRLVSEVKGDHAWISRDKINNALRARAAAKTRPSAASSFA